MVDVSVEEGKTQLNQNLSQDLETLRQNEHKKRVRIGYMMALFCAVLWGLWYVPGTTVWVLNPFDTMLAEVTITDGSAVATVITAVLISGLNAATVIIALMIWNGALGKFKEMGRTIRELKPCTRWYFLASICGGPIAILGSFIATGFIGAGFAAVAALLYPVIGSAVSYKYLGQKISKRAMLGIFIIIIGGFIIYVGKLITDLANGGGSTIGYIGGIMAALGWGLEGAIAAKGLDVSEPDVGITIRFLGENIIWWVLIIPILALLGFPMYTYAAQIFEPMVLITLIILGLTFGFCYVSWYKSFPLIGVGRGQGVGNLYGLFAVVFLFLFLGTPQDWTLILGGILCVAGSLVMFTEESLELQSLRRE